MEEGALRRSLFASGDMRSLVFAAMARPTRFEHHRWLGDKRTQRVHDLDAVTEQCGLDDLLASEQFAAFGPDVLAEARNRGYKACRHCVADDAA